VKAPRESDVLRACQRYLTTVRRWFVWRNNTGGAKIADRFVRFGAVGSADLLGVIPPAGRLLACECKQPGGKPTEKQQAWLAQARAAGAVVIVATGVEDLREQLRAAGYPE
jgi:hypothetical protein